MQTLAPQQDKATAVMTVSELNSLSKGLLETHLASVMVSGEISNLSTPASGHCYFSLKDEGAQLRCALFKQAKSRLPFSLENGQHVIARGKISLFAPRGDYQLIATQLILEGDGLLQHRFNQLKKRLQQEGLFDAQHKRPLPSFPHHLGIITSATGAALQDILRVLKRRFPLLRITVFPSAVQGQAAAAALCAALEQATMTKHACDVLILARGGGSLEDLWPFNEECVARAVFACPIPLVTGVGHEIDFTMVDFVADQRAPTPSAAAELVSPDQQACAHQLKQLQQQLHRAMQQRLQQSQLTLNQYQQRLRHPSDKLRETMQQLDSLEIRLHNSIHNTLARKQQHLNQCQLQLPPLNQTITHHHTHLNQLSEQLHSSTHRLVSKKQEQLSYTAHQLQQLSPLNTLSRGYCIAKDAQQQVRTSCHVPEGTTLTLQFHDGLCSATVTSETDR